MARRATRIRIDGPEAPELQVFVPGLPRAQPRPRMRVSRTGRFLGMNGRDDAITRCLAWRHAVALAAQAAWRRDLLEGPVNVELHFQFEHPPSHLRQDGSLRKRAPRHHTSRPDGENLSKALCDALNGVIYRDDSQIVELRVTKSYGPEPGCLVIVQQHA